jgi:hypothetical protein
MRSAHDHPKTLTFLSILFLLCLAHSTGPSHHTSGSCQSLTGRPGHHICRRANNLSSKIQLDMGGNCLVARTLWLASNSICSSSLASALLQPYRTHTSWAVMHAQSSIQMVSTQEARALYHCLPKQQQHQQLCLTHCSKRGLSLQLLAGRCCHLTAT